MKKFTKKCWSRESVYDVHLIRSSILDYMSSLKFLMEMLRFMQKRLSQNNKLVYRVRVVQVIINGPLFIYTQPVWNFEHLTLHLEEHILEQLMIINFEQIVSDLSISFFQLISMSLLEKLMKNSLFEKKNFIA